MKQLLELQRRQLPLAVIPQYTDLVIVAANLVATS
jgi:hypothetical protein